MRMRTQAASRDDSKQQQFNDHFGALVMVAISSMFGAAQPALLAFPTERPIFLREYSAGTYSVLPYFISKVCVELPLSFAQSLVQWVLVYFLIGFQGSFLLLLLASWALGCAATSVAVLLGCLVPDVKQAMEMTPVVFVPQMLFAGFFVRTSQIPIFLRWAQYLCSLKYSLNLLVLIEFSESRCDDFMGGATTGEPSPCETLRSSPPRSRDHLPRACQLAVACSRVRSLHHNTMSHHLE